MDTWIMFITSALACIRFSLRSLARSVVLKARHCAVCLYCLVFFDN